MNKYQIKYQPIDADDVPEMTKARVFRESKIFDTKTWWELTDEETDELLVCVCNFDLRFKSKAHNYIREQFDFPVVIFSL